MRYYFDFHDHYRVTDKRGENRKTLADAKLFAHVLAKELLKTSRAATVEGELVVVVDESGVEVYRAPLTGRKTLRLGSGHQLSRSN